MKYFVNMPASWIKADQKWLEMLLAKKLNPEIGLDLHSIALPRAWHKELATRLNDNGLSCAVHLPFRGLPGQDKAGEPQSLLQAAELANLYGAHHMIGHAAFNAETDALDSSAVQSICGCPACTAPYESIPPDPIPTATWLETSAHKWVQVFTASGGIPLFLENTFELSPLPLTLLLQKLPEQVRMCLDAGHWFSFAKGRDRENLSEWLKAIHPYLGHLHLHDNMGLADDHIGLGQGKIPFTKFFATLNDLKLYPTFTLEPHTVEALHASLEWMQTNEAFKRWMQAHN